LPSYNGSRIREEFSLGLPRNSDRGLPYKIHTALTYNYPVHLPAPLCGRPDRKIRDAYVRYAMPGKRDRASQGSNRQTLPIAIDTISSKPTLPTSSPPTTTLDG
jgi:hypothetical protein